MQLKGLDKGAPRKHILVGMIFHPEVHQIGCHSDQLIIKGTGTVDDNLAWLF